MALPKLFQRIFFHNDTTPAINEDNLNAISKGLSDVDDRVIGLAGTVMETVPQIQEYLEQADDLVEQLEDLTTNPPQIGANGHWIVWDTNTGAYVDSGIDASITFTVGTTSTLSPGSNATVENVGTDTDPILNFGIPQGQTGQPGDDGVSPAVTVTTIPGGHRVTITDSDHPTGQSFDVMDEPEFKNRYRLIVFAILNDHNAHQKHNPEGNFKPFADEFALNNNEFVFYRKYYYQQYVRSLY